MLGDILTDEQLEELMDALRDEGWEAPHFSRVRDVEVGTASPDGLVRLREEAIRKLQENDARAADENRASLRRALDRVSRDPVVEHLRAEQMATEPLQPGRYEVEIDAAGGVHWMRYSRTFKP
jgi:hypothetical protein